MSKEMRRTLLTLARNYSKNKPRIEKRLRKAGLKADPAVVFTVAIYSDCLNRLVNED
jgi:hypothetical protein